MASPFELCLNQSREKISLTAPTRQRKFCAEKLSSRISIQISTYTGHTLREEILMLDYSVFPSPWLLFLLIAWFQNWELREKSLSAVSHLAEPLLMAVERFEVSIGKKMKEVRDNGPLG